LYEANGGNGSAAIAVAHPSVSDSDLVAAVRAGEDAAFEELYRRYSRRIALFVYRFVRDEGRAEDVTQEAFLSALRRLRQTESEIAFRPWIYEIARNAAIDLHRRTSRAEEVSISADGALRPADRRRLVGSTAPDSALADKQRLEHFRGALDELSETHHRILILRELEGRSYREIGERMELTAPAVESTLFRARRRLEKEYAELDTGRRCASMRAVIARLAEGVESPREQRKLARHARHCSLCRRRARELGVDPSGQGLGVVGRAAALLPLPAFLRRRRDPGGGVDGGSVVALAPGIESTGAMLGKAAALLAAAALAGGGATLGGAGPLAPDLDSRGEAASPERPAGPVGARSKRAPDARVRGRGGARLEPGANAKPQQEADQPGSTASPRGPQAGETGDPDAGLPGLPDAENLEGLDNELPELSTVGPPPAPEVEAPSVPGVSVPAAPAQAPPPPEVAAPEVEQDASGAAPHPPHVPAPGI
jgi:RNA polymerase sigma factor (sigma-70 family)